MDEHKTFLSVTKLEAAIKIADEKIKRLQTFKVDTEMTLALRKAENLNVTTRITS